MSKLPSHSISDRPGKREQMRFPEGLSEKMDARVKEGTLRTLRVNEGLTDFFSNDYLGFASNTEIDRNARKFSKREPHVNGSTGSRLISGNTRAHEDLETDLALHFKAETALLFNSGYDANVGLLSAVLQRTDSVFFDRLAHASIRDGISLSSARSYGFEHNDLEDLERKFAKGRSSSGQNYVVVEAVYSMDGDEAPLRELAAFCRANGLYLIVDEAHSTGVFGPDGAGITASQGLESDIFARVHTFGKAMGCHGAAVVGSLSLKNYLVNFARSFIYTTALPAAEALRIKAALHELRTTDQRDKLRSVIDEFLRLAVETGVDRCLVPSRSPIQSFLLKDKGMAEEIMARMASEKIGSKAIFAPTVPRGQERIRICLHSFNTPDEIRRILQLLSTFV